MSDLKISMDAVNVGKAFSNTDAEAQADMINAFGRELFVACKGQRLFEMQCCFISDKLDQNGKKLLSELQGFVLLREETEPKKARG